MNQPALPAYLLNRQSGKIAQNLIGNLGAGTPPFISLKANRFTLIDSAGAEEPVETYDPKIGPYLDCVIVDSNDHLSKVYYDKAFDPNAQQYEPPACFSDNGIGPSRSAAKPQARTCAECPQGAWGSKTSAVSGKGIKACSDQQKLAILIPGDDVIFLLRVPPNSLSNLRGYTAKFVGQQVDVSDVVTRIWFESQGTVQFAATTFIDEATAGQREKVLVAKGTDALVGRTDMPRQDALGSPTQAPPAQITAQPAAQSVETPAFVPSQPAAQSSPVTQTPAGGAPTASPSDLTPTGRPRRKRNTAAAEAPPQPAGAPMASFRPAVPEQAAQPGSFGIQPGSTPSPEIESTLNSIFGPS